MNSTYIPLATYSQTRHVKEFKQSSPPVFSIPKTTLDGPLDYPFFRLFIAQHTSSTSILCTAPATLLAATLSPTYFQYLLIFPSFFQIFIQSFKLSLVTPSSSSRQFTPITSCFPPALCLVILNNSQISQQQSVFSITFWATADPYPLKQFS